MHFTQGKNDCIVRTLNNMACPDLWVNTEYFYREWDYDWYTGDEFNNNVYDYMAYLRLETEQTRRSRCYQELINIYIFIMDF